jgi:hypothetical protein
MKRRHDDPENMGVVTYRSINVWIVGSIVAFITVGIIYATRETKQDDKINDIDIRVSKCEFQIGTGIDSIKIFQRDILEQLRKLKSLK